MFALDVDGVSITALAASGCAAKKVYALLRNGCYMHLQQKDPVHVKVSWKT